MDARRDGVSRLIYAIDPGCEESALLVYDPSRRRPVTGRTDTNERIRQLLLDANSTSDVLVVEKIESYGMAVGREVFDTVWWSGRFHEVWTDPGIAFRLPRKEVKIHLCGHTRATDSNIRQAIYDIYGGKKQAKGVTKQPGPLFGLKGHEYAALAVAITFAETTDGIQFTEATNYAKG